MTYMIIRFYRNNDEKKVIATGLTLEEAREHCRDPETSTDEYFDGYDCEECFEALAIENDIEATDIKHDNYGDQSMRAIVIKITEGKATASEFEHKDYTDINENIGCRIFTSGGYTETGEAVYIDDEGLLVEGNLVSNTAFYPTPLAGNFVITGIDRDSGYPRPSKLTLDEAEALITEPGFGFTTGG